MEVFDIMKMIVPNAQEIRNFLKGDYKILNVISESEKIINNIFGEVPLEMYLSKEYNEMIVVHIKYQGEDMSSKMKRFDRWFLKKKVNHKLIFLI